MQAGENLNDMMSMFDGSLIDSYSGTPMTLDVDSPTLQQQLQFTGASAAPNLPGSSAFPTVDDMNLLDEDAISNGPAASSAAAGNFGSSQGTGAHSTVTEFTKRRNWPAKVVEELRDLLKILDSNGRIKHVSPSLTRLTGYNPEDVLERFLRDFIHPDDVGVFVAELNESIATGNTLRVIYRFKKKDGTYCIFEAVGHGHIANPKFATNPNNQSPFCQAVFMMSRAYPTKNAGFLDTILEHRMENERLQRRIAELRREEAEELEEAQRTSNFSQGVRSDMAPSSEETTQAANTPFPPSAGSPDASMSMLPPPSRTHNAALTRENLEGIVGSRPDSIREKMARYEGATSHTDTIERLTGLRYVEGERSRGITTGSGSPALIKGDAGIALPAERDPRTGEKKKKQKVAEEYVCTDCGKPLLFPPSLPRQLASGCFRSFESNRDPRHARLP